MDLFDLGYQEIDEAELSAVFSYCGIEESNSPIGVPFESGGEVAVGDYLLFSLAGFAQHLKDLDPRVGELYEAHRDVDRVLSEPGFDNARTFLITALLAGIDHCLTNQQLLIIRW